MILLGCLLACTASAILPYPGIKVKPGQCPKDVDYPTCDFTTDDVKDSECLIDQDCKGKAKCCYSGCQNRCRLPLEDKTDACPSHNAAPCIAIRPSPSDCHDDQQCQGSERCCCHNCNYQCVPTVKVKPGQCPAQPKKCPLVAAVEGPDLSDANEDLIKPPRRCKTDADCTGDQKCCDYCGMTCRSPIKEHSGFCPVSNKQISCGTILEKPRCNSDADCKLKDKCCLVDNHMECVPALKEKSGVCPVPLIKCLKKPGPDKCQGDKDCVDNKKCCDTGCIKECITPYFISDIVKPGTCPIVETLVACKIPFPPGECTRDSHCPDKKKCCDGGCFFHCVDV
uniref:WAP domain-containing protein n=1 Tax=Leptobrachium leishanense TaxID=445787 RepID=A0A8C5PWP6_9ANUR